MRDDNSRLPLEEVENPVVDVVVLDSKLVNVLTKVFRMGPTQLVALIFQQTQTCKTTIPSLGLKAIESIPQRNRAI